MSDLDFLFQGKAPPSVATSSNETRTVPSWLSDYAQGLLARANQIAGEPYQTYQGPRIAGFDPAETRAQGLAESTVGAWQPSTGAASDAYGRVLGGPGALTTAMPFLAQGAGSYTDAVDKYMNPYVENVIDRSTLLAQRALGEKLMPSINKNFVTSGTYGSAGQQRAVGHALRDVTGELQSQNRAALADAYTSGANIFSEEAQRKLQAGEQAGSLYGQDMSDYLNAGQGYGALGQMISKLNAADIAQLGAAGADRRAMEQANFDLARSDFEAQRDYPKTQANWLAELLTKLPNMGGTTSTTGTQPAGAVGPSPLQQVGAIGSGVAGLMDVWDRIWGNKEQDPVEEVRIPQRPHLPEDPNDPFGSARGGLARYAHGGVNHIVGPVSGFDRYRRGGLRYARGGRVRREGGLATYRRIRHG